MVTLVELHDRICRLEKFTEGQTSLQHSTDLGFMAVWPNSILSSVKTHENTLGICRKAPKGPSDCEKQYYLVSWTSIPSIMFEGNQLCSSPAEYHPKSKVCFTWKPENVHLPPSNLTELERWGEEWQIIAKFWYAKLVISYPKRLEAVKVLQLSTELRVWILMQCTYFSFFYL